MRVLAILDASWGCLDVVSGYLASFWASLNLSEAFLGSLGLFGAGLSLPGVVLGVSWAGLRLSWDVLGELGRL